MKIIARMQRLLGLCCLFLLGMGITSAQVEIVVKDCSKVPCFTKSPNKTIGNPIIPPDYPIMLAVNFSNVLDAESGFGNIGGELRIGFAPKRTYIGTYNVVADPDYARKNDLKDELLDEGTFELRNSRVPYYEAAIRLTTLDFSSLNGLSGGRAFQLRYVDIVPLGFRYELGKRLSFGLGASFSLLTNAVRDGDEITDLETAGFNRWEPGLLANVQYGKRGRGLQAGITYNQRFSYLSETNLRYGIAQLYIGWGFGGKK